MSLQIQVAGRSDLGCMRSNNEDNFGYDSRYGIYVVCDGMGGAAAGEVASKIAVDTVLNYCRQAAKDKLEPSGVASFGVASAGANRLARAIQFANQQIRAAAEENPENRGMGSTITAVLVEGGIYSIAHVGDSRIYLLRRGSIQQITQDHSLVMEHVRRGLITAEQAEHSEIRNIIIRALGSEERVEPDLSDLVAEPGDVVLLTTDGLTRHIPDAEILEIVAQASSCRQACEQLVESAKQAGGYDNITCLLLQFVEETRTLVGEDGTPKWQNSM